ncbi:MAG: hypothetical protein B6U97_03745 [Candidatus Altiarchaeales archaeon ex4484_96]|nr:MAG: hypothetical protein B6U97_03745 [Candidatus Altiarchaeales archaeon ex4484_96]
MNNKLDTDNVRVDPMGRFVVIRINAKLYKQHIIMRAADDLIHAQKNYDVIIDGNPESEIKAKFIPKTKDATKDDLLKVAYKFNTLLVSCCGKG